MAAKSTRAALVVVVALLVALEQPVGSQSSTLADIYRGVMAVYAVGGDLKGAVIPLQSWTRKEFQSAIGAVAAGGREAEIRTAAVLQLEFGVAIVGVATSSTEQHFALGETLANAMLGRFRKAQAMPSEVAEFWSTWYAVAGSAYLSISDVRRARPFLGRAVRLAPRSAAAQILWGAADELDAGAFDPGMFSDGGVRTRISLQQRRRLLAIVDLYRNVLKFAPDDAAAHLRLGRMLLMLNELPQARLMAERAESLAQEPGHRYLSALVLGAILQQQQDLGGARAAYERAQAVVPASQSATAALGFLDVLDGRPDLARARVEAFLSKPADDQHWWELNNGGLHHAGLAWLRAKVRR